MLERILGLWLCISMLAFPGLANAKELDESERIQAAGKAAFRAGDFAKIDELATQYRSTRSRTPSGLWHLTALYAGVSQGMSTDKYTDAHWSDIESKTNRWIASAPSSASAPIVHSMALTQHAWFHRGSGFANTVTPSGWEQFARYSELSRQTLEKNKKISSTDPRWYQQMLEIAQMQQWDQQSTKALYVEALSKEPLFYQTYFAAVDKLLPMWSGSLEEIEKFADDAVARTQKSEAKGMHARIFWYVEQRIGKALFERKSIWPKMKTGFEDLLKQYPDAWNKNNYARYACQNGDFEVTKKLLMEIGSDPMLDGWRDSRIFFDQCKAWVSQIDALKTKP